MRKQKDLNKYTTHINYANKGDIILKVANIDHWISIPFVRYENSFCLFWFCFLANFSADRQVSHVREWVPRSVSLVDKSTVFSNCTIDDDNEYTNIQYIHTYSLIMWAWIVMCVCACGLCGNRENHPCF